MIRQELLKIAKPILFNTDMVQAILDGRKTVTRRLIKANLVEDGKYEYEAANGCYRHKLADCAAYNQFYDVKIKPPYKVGDYLYVRETWTPFCINKSTCVNALLSHSDFCFKASLDSKIYGCCDTLSCKWHPSIHMPKAAARIFLRVTDVRVERLKDITADGILAEGVDVEIPPICKQSMNLNFPSDEQLAQWEKMSEAQREVYIQNMARHTYIGWCDYADRLFNAFVNLWNSTVKKSNLDLYGWKANPWVWVVSFERVEVE